MADEPLDTQKTVAIPHGGAPPESHGTTERRIKPPSQVGDFALGRQLGAGGMGTVHEAVSPRFPGKVALKLLRPEIGRDPDFAARFEREIVAMRRVEHPNVVKILDAGVERSWRWMALELMTRGDLAGYLERRGQLFDQDAVQMGIQCCRGLAAMHAAGLVHRDLKPGNIFLGPANAVKIGDLGMARQESGADRMTMTGIACGTPSYMAPEQIQGRGDLDHRLDVYALGATLFTLVTGKEPYEGPTIYVITHKAMTTPMPDPRSINPQVSPALAAVILKACAKDRNERYQTIEELMAELERLQRGQQPVQASVQRTVPAATGSAPTVMSNIGPASHGAHASGAVSAGGLGRPSAGVGWWGSIPSSVRYTIPFLVVGMILFAVMSSTEGGTQVAKKPKPGPAAPGGQASDQYGVHADLAIGGAHARLRWCPPGVFFMGSLGGEPGRNPDETLHRVTLSPPGFWILDREVSQQLWDAVEGRGSDDLRPVTAVTSVDAEDWLDQLNGRLDGVTAELPTEAQWELAARAGTSTPFAGEPTRMASAGEQRFAALWAGAEQSQAEERLRQEIGAELVPPRGATLEPNAWGLFDMHGGVMEWTRDRSNGSDPLTAEAVLDPIGTTGSLVVARGGSWLHPLRHCRSASRMAYDRIVARPWIGFRFIVVGPRDRPPRLKLK